MASIEPRLIAQNPRKLRSKSLAKRYRKGRTFHVQKYTCWIRNADEARRALSRWENMSWRSTLRGTGTARGNNIPSTVVAKKRKTLQGAKIAPCDALGFPFVAFPCESPGTFDNLSGGTGVDSETEPARP
jgi:hypothetical protein